MRKQHLLWTLLVFAVVLTMYGAFSVIYNQVHDKELSTLGVIFLSIGSAMLLAFFVLLIISLIQAKKNKSEEKVIDAKVEEVGKEVIKDEYNTKTVAKHEQKPNKSRYDTDYTPSRSSSIYDAETVYVKKVGYGSIIRVCGDQILDMQSNTYYRIEGNRLKQEGYGYVYEIYGSKIKLAYGQYLYEISGNNISKVFGGYFAHFNGNFIQTNDLSQIYEASGSLNTTQKLCVIVLLFGRY